MYPPEIYYTSPYGSEKCDLSDYRSAASSMPNLTKTSVLTNQSVNNSVSTNSRNQDNRVCGSSKGAQTIIFNCSIPDPMQFNPQHHIKVMQPTCNPILVTDSGCTHTMTGLLYLFESVTHYHPINRPRVTLGDNTTKCQIHGYDYIMLQIKNIKVCLLAFSPVHQTTHTVAKYPIPYQK